MADSTLQQVCVQKMKVWRIFCNQLTEPVRLSWPVHHLIAGHNENATGAVDRDCANKIKCFKRLSGLTIFQDCKVKKNV
ncbi:hypothetical protein C1N63_17955 [Pantoea ananatis]|nr:hypothetical protein C1N63_17955 [Pantoea ananatis]PZD62938.1 hypothetical protein ARC272_12970 [Pantoea ananatis]